MPDIEAKVAKVLDEYRIAINAGEDRGVQPRDDVTLWRIVEVKDPDSGEVLGSAYLDALRLQVSDVYPKMCIARVAGDTSFLLNITGPRKRIEAPGLRVADSVRVQVGDLVSIRISEPAGAGSDGARAEG